MAAVDQIVAADSSGEHLADQTSYDSCKEEWIDSWRVGERSRCPRRQTGLDPKVGELVYRLKRKVRICKNRADVDLPTALRMITGASIRHALTCGKLSPQPVLAGATPPRAGAAAVIWLSFAREGAPDGRFREPRRAGSGVS